MKTKRMGRTGLKVSEICLGTMTFGRQCDEATSFAVMDTAFEHGVDFFDTADVYPAGGGVETAGRTEEIVGKWLKERREDVVLATKCWGAMGDRPNDSGLSRKHVFAAVEASLRRLQTDYIDLYQVHAPDPRTPIDETLGALDDLVHQGKVRYIGCSNFQAWRLAFALWQSDKLGLARFECVQPRYNMLFREIEHELFPLCREQNIGMIPYNPLAGGFLTGKHASDAPPAADTRFALSGRAGETYRARYWHDAQFRAVEDLKQFFAARNRSIVQVAIAWVLAQPEVTAPIVGATSATQLEQSLPAVDLTLDDEEMDACDDIWFRLPRPRDKAVALR